MNQYEMEAAKLILDYAQTDGAHHKTWVLDQVLKILLHDDEKAYKDIIETYCNDGEYEWDVGVAP